MERASGAMTNVAGTWGLVLLTIMDFYLYAQPSFHIFRIAQHGNVMANRSGAKTIAHF
jgi:hypothetical protein